MSRRTSRKILAATEVLELDLALIAVYAEYARLRERHPAAKRIARPGVPAVFSESLVAHASGALFGVGAEGEFGGREADLRISRPGAPDLLVEVKASGHHAWQEIKVRDLERDVFVWVAFGHRYETGSGPIEVYLLAEPKSYRLPRRKLTLELFLRGASRLPGFWMIRFAGVAEMLGAEVLAGAGTSKLAQQVAQQGFQIGI
jgi:hypothetical protein